MHAAAVDRSRRTRGGVFIAIAVRAGAEGRIRLRTIGVERS
jgi:hypothetical protein